ncbi:MAG: hypothetical protein JYX80_06480 [Candidatus Scalindua sediminis]|nr:hypothetical protein [Candidatus Scalindua sediminis]
MGNQIQKRIKGTMSAIFNVPVDEIDSTASPRTIKSWKGKNHLKMVEALESEFDIKFEECEIETLVSYKVIKATVMAYVS